MDDAPAPIAYNTAILLRLPIGGVGAYVLGRYVTGDRTASFVGGLVFMMSPFLVTKVLAGWTDMLYAGLLPIFVVCLFEATSLTSDRARHARIALAATTVFLILTGMPNCVFAANVGALFAAWRVWTTGWRDASRRLAWALAPGLSIVAVYGVWLTYLIVRDFGSIGTLHRYSNIPSRCLTFCPSAARRCTRRLPIVSTCRRR